MMPLTFRSRSAWLYLIWCCWRQLSAALPLSTTDDSWRSETNHHSSPDRWHRLQPADRNSWSMVDTAPPTSPLDTAYSTASAGGSGAREEDVEVSDSYNMHNVINDTKSNNDHNNARVNVASFKLSAKNLWRDDSSQTSQQSLFLQPLSPVSLPSPPPQPSPLPTSPLRPPAKIMSLLLQQRTSANASLADERQQVSNINMAVSWGS